MIWLQTSVKRVWFLDHSHHQYWFYFTRTAQVRIHKHKHQLTTNSMEQSRSQEANRFSARQEIPSIVWNRKVHYRIHKSPPPVPVLTRAIQSTPPSHFLWIYLNIIISSTPVSSKWSVFLRFPHQIPVYTSSFPYTCYVTYPSHSSWFDHPNNICWEVRIINLLIR